jgi:hypothetical protein
MKQNPPQLLSKGLTPFAQAMPDCYRGSDPIEAYRKYYAFKTTYMKVVWKKLDNEPHWWQSDLIEDSIRQYELVKVG